MRSAPSSLPPSSRVARDRERGLPGTGHLVLATADLERLKSLYTRMFDATTDDLGPGRAFIRVGERTALHAFARPDLERNTAPGTTDPSNTSRSKRRPRRLHHPPRPPSHEGCATDTITDLGPLVSVFFTDPDALLRELTLWKCPNWNPPFQATPFAQPAGTGSR